MTATSVILYSRFWHHPELGNSRAIDDHHLLLSVFPSGSSIGQAHGNPMPKYSAQDIERQFAALSMGQGSSHGNQRSYGSATHQFNSKFELVNIDGVVGFGSSTLQKNNVVKPQKPNDQVSFGSLTHQGHNSYSLSNVHDRVTFGSETVQEGNTYF